MNLHFIKGFEKEASLAKFVARHGIASLGKKNVKALINKTQKDSPGLMSLVGLLAKKPAEWTIGKNRVKKISDKVQKAILDTDTIAGKGLDKTIGKIPGLNKLFKQTETVSAGKNKYRDIVRTSASKPLAATSAFVLPVYTGSKLTEDAEKLRKRRNEQGTI